MNLIIKAVCLFCDTTVIGQTKNMVGGKHPRDGRKKVAAELKAKPEFRWQWNGLGEAIFFLCPNHQGEAHFEKAFEWAKQEIGEVNGARDCNSYS